MKKSVGVAPHCQKHIKHYFVKDTTLGGALVRPHQPTAIKRGSFDSVTQLVKTIEAFIENYNACASPFVWVATAESIFGKLERLSARIWGT